MEIRNILVAVDDSHLSDTVCRAACDIAEGARARLHIAHAWSLGMVPGLFPYYRYAASPTRSAALAANKVLERFRERAESRLGQECTIHLVQSTPVRAVHDLVLHLDIDLVVMGGHVTNAIQALFAHPGSEEVLHHAHRAVLVLHGDASQWPPQSVVCFDDGSRIAREVESTAGAIARYLATPMRLIEVASNAIPGSAEDLQHHLALRAERIEAAEGVEVTPELLVSSHVAETLIAKVGENPGALIAMGTRAKGAQTGVHFGSVAMKVLRTTTGPVLIVPRSVLNRPKFLSSVPDTTPAAPRYHG